MSPRPAINLIGFAQRKSTGRNAVRLHCVSTIVPQSGIYSITHDPTGDGMPHEVTVIKGRRFPTCRLRKGVVFEVAHAAKHARAIDQLEEAHAPAG